MNKFIKSFILMSFVLIFVSCSNKTTTNSQETNISNDSTHVDTSDMTLDNLSEKITY